MILSFGLVYSCLCLCIFSRSVSIFLSIHPPLSDIYLILSACVHLDKQPSLQSCLATFHHLSTWSHRYETFSCTSDLDKTPSREDLKCSVALRPRGGLTVTGGILLFIGVVPVFPAGSCPTPPRTLQPCWAHQRKEPSTWPGPSRLMGTVPSYATSWRFPRTVSHILEVFVQSYISASHLQSGEQQTWLQRWFLGVFSPSAKLWLQHQHVTNTKLRSAVGWRGTKLISVKIFLQSHIAITCHKHGAMQAVSCWQGRCYCSSSIL